MRYPRALLLAVTLSGAPAAAETTAPPEAMIVDVAQNFVASKFDRPADRRFSLAFDVARVHPQPGGDYWAVVGGFMADIGAKTYRPHLFVAAVRLICPSHEKLACWRLEKLAIKRTDLVGQGGEPRSATR